MITKRKEKQLSPQSEQLISYTEALLVLRKTTIFCWELERARIAGFIFHLDLCQEIRRDTLCKKIKNKNDNLRQMYAACQTSMPTSCVFTDCLVALRDELWFYFTQGLSNFKQLEQTFYFFFSRILIPEGEAWCEIMIDRLRSRSQLYRFSFFPSTSSFHWLLPPLSWMENKHTTHALLWVLQHF